MNIKYLSSIIIAAACLFTAPCYSGESKQTPTSQQGESVRNPLVSPRDAASGLPTGKRQHKPVRTTRPVDKASPLLASPMTTPPKNTTGKKSAYRLCPDGTTMVNPGEKCPEKTKQR